MYSINRDSVGDVRVCYTADVHNSGVSVKTVFLKMRTRVCMCVQVLWVAEVWQRCVCMFINVWHYVQCVYVH